MTNEQSYSNETLARVDYEMPEKDRLATQLQSKGFGGMRGSRHNLVEPESFAPAEVPNPFPNGAEKKPHVQGVPPEPKLEEAPGKANGASPQEPSKKA